MARPLAASPPGTVVVFESNPLRMNATNLRASFGSRRNDGMPVPAIPVATSVVSAASVDARGSGP